MTLPGPPGTGLDTGGPSAPHALVVTEDEGVAQALTSRLSGMGCTVGHAGSGAEAMMHLGQFPTDILLVPMGRLAPGHVALLPEIQAAFPDLQVVLVTDAAVAGPVPSAGTGQVDEANRGDVLEGVRRLVAYARQAGGDAIRRVPGSRARKADFEAENAAAVQADLLPREPPDVAGFDVAARCVSTQGVGGDYYDWQVTSPGTALLTLCDVMGHGTAAALLMATVRAALRTLATGVSPARDMEAVARALGEDLERTGRFVTAVLARIDGPSGRVELADAGHGLVFAVRVSGVVDSPLGHGGREARGFPLGVFPDQTYEDALIVLDPGDLLVLHSDGLLDALGGEGTRREGLAGLVVGARTASDAVNRLVSAARRRGPPGDDLTVMVVRRTDDIGATTV